MNMTCWYFYHYCTSCCHSLVTNDAQIGSLSRPQQVSPSVLLNVMPAFSTILPLCFSPLACVCFCHQLVHQDVNKRHLTAEWVMPVMPDVSLWPNTYTTVMFDKDPAADETVKGSEVRRDWVGGSLTRNEQSANDSVLVFGRPARQGRWRLYVVRSISFFKEGTIW